jgi:holin-like protein
MIKGVATLLGFQLIGEILARLGQLPISGPICGMAAFLICLHLHGKVGDDLGKVCDGMLANMALLFVPVGVGAMSYSSLFATKWPLIALAIVMGASATLLTTVFITRALTAWAARHAPSIRSSERLPIAQ